MAITNGRQQTKNFRSPVMLLPALCFFFVLFVDVPAHAMVSCEISVTRLESARPEIFHDRQEVPIPKRTPEDTVLYRWGTNTITADVFTGGILGIIWKEKPFGFRAGTLENLSFPKRHFFIEDPSAKIGIDVSCERND